MMSESGKIVAADGHVYHKSKTANATVAPTNAATLENATKTSGLTPAEIQFVTIADYEHNLGKFNVTHLVKEYGYTESELRDLVSSTDVQGALSERGITATVLLPSTESKQSKISPIQLIVANRLLDLTDNRSDKKKLQDSGVTTLQYSAWLSDPNFTDYMRDRAEGLLGSSHHEILLALMDRVKARDTSAIKLALEVTGRHVSQTSSGNAGASSFDVSSIITRVVEIIIDEVEDQSTAIRIAERIQGLVIGAQVSGQMPMEAITQPEIATPRVITKEVQELMNQGVGYDN